MTLGGAGEFAEVPVRTELVGRVAELAALGTALAGVGWTGAGVSATGPAGVSATAHPGASGTAHPGASGTADPGTGGTGEPGAAVASHIADGTAILIQGDPGAGKTVLLEAVAARAGADGLRVLPVVGVETELELAFATLHQLLHPLLHRTADLPGFQRGVLEQVFAMRAGAAPDRFAISSAALALLQAAAREQPLLVVVDDAHWIDRSSAQVLAFMARRLTGTRAAFVIAARSGWTSFLDRAGLRVLTLGPLPDPDAVALLDSRYPGLSAGTRRRLIDEAQGNPLALVELPGQLTAGQREGAEPLPQTLPLGSRLEAVFADRIRELPEPTRFALLLAALEGQRPGSLRTVRAAAPLSEQEWDDKLLDASERTGLVRIDHVADQVTFRHPLARSCLVRMSPTAVRHSAHRALAAVLTGDPERRAWHLAHAAEGPDEAVAAALAAAGERALARGGAAEAAAAFLRAAELSPDAADRARRQDEAAFVAGKGGLLDQARELAGAGAHGASGPQPAEQQSIRGAAAAAYVLFHRDGDVDGVFRTLVPVLDTAPASACDADAEAFDDAFYVLLITCVWAGRPDLWPPLHRALDRVSETARMCFAAVADPARTAHGVRARLDRATAALPPAIRFWRVSWLIFTALYLDCFGYYDGVWRGFVDQAAYDSHQFVMVARTYDSFVRGDWDNAVALASEGTEVAADHGYNFTHLLFKYGLASVAASRGDEEALRALNDEITTWARPRRFELMAGTVQETRARAAVTRGDFEEAYHLAAAVTPPGVLPAYFPHVNRPFLDLVESAVRTGRLAEARAHVTAGRQARLELISPRHALILAGAEALTAPDEQAGPLFETALALPDAALWGFDHARIRLLYGEWLRRRLGQVAARPHLRAALETFESLRAEPWARRARAELRAAGVSVRGRSQQGGGGQSLSAQEYRIAQFAAKGLSNKEIGSLLNVSPRTVGAHLYKAFPKLGITSRAALRDALAELDGPG
ncbi:helix-turn-helix transcriptional regulator [Streptomyces sp.]|uniref:helix-turn-helix transcriptional regulator n=1 Tax=Streptomyces sp. TaxID=1931 RepID=UPI002F3F719F